MSEHTHKNPIAILNELFDIGPIPMAIISKEKNVITRINQDFISLGGFSNENEIIGKSCEELGIWKDLNNHASFIKKMDEEKIVKNHEAIFKSKDNKLKHCLVSGKKWIQDENYYIVMIVDITTLKNEQEKIIQNNKKYKELLRRTKTAFVILDKKNHEISEYNEIFEDILNKCSTTHPNIIGTTFYSIIHSASLSRFSNMIENLKNDIVQNVEICLEISGNTNWISIDASMIQNGSDKIICLIKDIQNKRENEQKKKIILEKKKDGISQEIKRFAKELAKINMI
jgi:PAS domain S-box-containing protein